MALPRRNAILLVALAASLVVGVGVALAFPAPATASTTTSTGHTMTPAEQCQHMPEMCPSGGNSTAG